LLIVATFLLRPERADLDQPAPGPVPGEIEGPAGPGHGYQVEPPTTSSALGGRSTGERDEVAISDVVHIVSTDGTSIAGAELTWTSVVPTLLESVWDWDEIDVAWLRSTTTHAFSDSVGRVQPQTPALHAELGSIVWIDHDDYTPVFDVLAPADISLGGRRYELMPAVGVRVIVLDAGGMPVDSAVVEQHGKELRVGVEAPVHAPLLFERFRTTDANGVCTATRFPGRQALVARRGSFASRPIVIDELRTEVTLRLQGVFTASGTVTRPTDPDVRGEIVPRITIEARNGNLWRELATAVSHRDGTWGPLEVPCEPANGGVSYRALVHGTAVVTEQTPFSEPAPGDHVVLHLDARTGTQQWFMGYDGEQGTPLLGTTATVSWEDDGAILSVSSRARPDGYVNVLGIRPGPVHATLTKPGYSGSVMPALELPEATPRTITDILTKGVEVTGRVLRNGKPVPDFELTYWKDDEVTFRQTVEFHDQPDGTFLIEGLAIGSWGLVASAPDSPGSRPLQVDVTEQRIGDLVLELLPAVRGSGRVLRAINASPATDAIVQPYVLGGGAPLTPWGVPLLVGPDGVFEGMAFREGENYLMVGAPGFGTQTVFAESDAGSVDFGLVELNPSAELKIEVLDGVEGAYRFYVNGPAPRSTDRFERTESGSLVARLGDLPLGDFVIELTHPNLNTTFRKLSIRSGENVILFRAGSGSVKVLYRDAGDHGYELAIEMYDSRGEWEWYATNFTPEGVAEMTNLPAGEARLYVREGDTAVASASATIRAGEETLVELKTGSMDLLLRVLNGEDDAVSGASVRLTSTDAVKQRYGGLTNADGEYLFRSLSRATYLLRVSHPTLGLLSDVEIVIDSDEPIEREVVLDGSASLDLLLVDGDDPLPGLVCKLLDSFGSDLTAAVLSNDQGRAQIPRLTPGAYRLSVAGDHVWPVSLDVDVQKGAGLRTLDVRRLGDLVIRVVSAEGVPVLGTEVELVDQRTGTAVSDWLAAGLVAGSAELVSDKHGEIALVGLPHGAYAWKLGAAAGVLNVVAGKESLALLTAE
jgi:hypothetical protein